MTNRAAAEQTGAESVRTGEFSQGDTVVVEAAAGKMVLTARHTRAA